MAGPDDKPAPIKAEILDPDQLEFFKEFIRVQREEIEVKKQRFEIEQQGQKHAHEFAKLSLDAQVKDREAERTHRYNHGRRTYTFIAILTTLLLVFAGFAVYMGKEDIVKEMGQLLVMVFGAASAGYAFCLKKHTPKVSAKDSDDDADDH